MNYQKPGEIYRALETSLLLPHWIPVFWEILWRTGSWPSLVFHETEVIDGYAAFGWWEPVPCWR